MRNLIILSILGIQFESENHSFRDDGFVEDVHKHAREIYKEFGDNPDVYYLNLLLKEGKLPLVSGLTLISPNIIPPINVIIFYQHCNSYLKEIFIRGHEETHVLYYLGKIDLLQKELTVCRLKTDILSCLDAELIADIGGLYTLIKHKINPKDITLFLDNEKKFGLLKVYLEFLGDKSAQFQN